MTTWRSRKLKVVNSLPKSNRFGVIGERQPRALVAAVELTALQAAASSTRCSTEQAKATRWCSRSACSTTTRWFWASGWRQWEKFCCKNRRPAHCARVYFAALAAALRDCLTSPRLAAAAGTRPTAAAWRAAACRCAGAAPRPATCTCAGARCTCWRACCRWAHWWIWMRRAA